MSGSKVIEFMFRKSDQVKNMLQKLSIKHSGETVEVDPEGLVIAGMNSGELQEVFKYKLCSFPSDFFNSLQVALSECIKKNPKCKQMLQLQLHLF